MADRKKVVKGLECCLTLDSPCGDCPYYSYEEIQELECERNLRHDALELLKYQKPKRDPVWDFACPRNGCHHRLRYLQSFCDLCGQALNWNETDKV